jgi:hypothetical protein
MSPFSRRVLHRRGDFRQGLLKQLEDFVGNVDAIALLPRHFSEYPCLGEPIHDLLGVLC